ncbi:MULTISPECIES: STM4015 family protein [Streptomyces]|uniref:STM4015 family protein n=1 Tax=Streptomyces edwardsiae TaxID=3075527 RepID=A0ABU2PZX8_9ACTN|nr:STM4015 family protein [Streptomyces sp. DSM 41636]MDT0397351.1 STM4015 family protein [Streptomyces sp. DSM 41636]
MELLADVPRHPRSVDHLDRFHGLPVLTFPQASLPRPLPDDPASVAWRVGVGLREDDERTDVYWDRFVANVPLEEVRALVLGAPWFGSDGMGEYLIEALVELRDRLPRLEALFLGDVHFEESELSWMEQCDVAPVLEAYPGLRELGVRGSNGLGFPVIRHEGLRTLRFETGGLPASVTRNVAASELPNLEYLELWLGDEWYGCDTTLEDLQPFLTGERLPSLLHLGLQNSQFQDEIAAAVAQAPVVARLESLRLSMGVLGDEGAEALLGGQPLTHLRFLDLHHHYLSDAMMLRLWDALEPAGVRVDLTGNGDEDDEDEDDDTRYVAVSE